MVSTVGVVQPSGILNGTQVKPFKQEVISIVGAGIQDILVDLKDVTFVDSSGLGALLAALKAVKVAGGRLFLCSVSNEIKIMLEIADVDKFFEIFVDRDSFESWFQSVE